MGNVRHFYKQQEDPELFLADLAARKIDPMSVMVLMKLKNGEWMTGWAGCDQLTHAEAIAHAQVDLIDRFMVANMDRYIGND